MLKYIYVLIQDVILREQCLKYFRINTNNIDRTQKIYKCSDLKAGSDLLVITSTEGLDENYTDSLILLDDDSNISTNTNTDAVKDIHGFGARAAQLGVGVNYRGDLKYVLENFEDVDYEYFEMVYNRHHGIPVNILETKRLLVREIGIEDLPALYRLYEQVPDYVEPLYEFEKELDFTKNYINHMYGFYGYGLWLVFQKDTGELIGRMGLENRQIDGVTEVELGYLVSGRYRGKGYAYECCSAILDYAFQSLEIDTVFLCTDIKNIPSIHLGRKLGFQLYAENIEGMNIYRIKTALHLS